MCTNIATTTRIAGSAKSADGWRSVDQATIGYDHATHAWVEHAVRLDFWDSRRADADHVAIELDLASGRELLRRLQDVVDAAEGQKVRTRSASITSFT